MDQSGERVKKILIAPLDWGLGHATRCIPIIGLLIQKGCKVFIAASGKTEKLLRTEFPTAEFIHLKGYNIRYPAKMGAFTLKIIFQIPKILRAVRHERRWLNKLINEKKADIVISDNRFGLYHPGAVSIIITHQLMIRTGLGKWADLFIQHLNYRYIRRFTHCWVPDFENPNNNLAGILSHAPQLPNNASYIGGLSRFETGNFELKYNALLVLSGPEPQRTEWEEMILKQLSESDEKVLVIRGLPGENTVAPSFNNTETVNHLNARRMNEAFLQSEFIISRSGYTTIMDIIKLRKKAILIPTPGQTEQEYLASYLMSKKICYSVPQKKFSFQEVLANARQFPYVQPEFNMEQYIATVSALLDTL
ncbi:MAG: glycosyltransferase [Chitinophagaceae bacterium]|nr:glycosyltransferase [Chitinophagaceae bacterium]